MKTFLQALLALFCIGNLSARGQCPGGQNAIAINWDYLDFFPSSGNASYTNLASSQTQRFAFGTQRLTLTHNYTGSNAPGENNSHTGETSSYGTGTDVQFLGNGVITVSFQSAVSNVRFSVYDIDVNQRVQVTALNGASSMPVTMARVAGTSITVTGNGTTTALASASSAAVATNSNTAAINIDLPGPITSFTITITNTGIVDSGPASNREDGSFWLSDISACSSSSFTANYYNASRPMTGQPGYVIAVRDNSVYYVNPANGAAKLIFTDPGHTNINSLAYDPVNRFIYYVFSLTNGGSTNASNRALRRYDYNMDTFGVVLNDITTIGIPTFDVGVESGAATFFDGSLYLGIEASSSSVYESIVWKIDFNASFTPVSASQLYGITGSGHDWADIGISNGTFYDFNGSATSPDFYHMNMLTHEVTQLAPASGLIPRQVGIDWNGQVYNIGQPSSGGTGIITPYAYNGSLNTASQQTITLNGVAVTGSWGDAAEAFVPKLDFGDAPATYDPAGSDPAVHERITTLRLGNNIDDEFTTRGQTLLANADNFDDGLPFVHIFNPIAGNYLTQVNVFNNTGANATVCAWLDYNGNGVFEASEGISLSVPSSGSVQSVYLYWPSTPSSLANNSYTFLRIRIARASSNMTAANPIGYFSDGEVEDYRVFVNSYPLPIHLLSFEARKYTEKSAAIQWSVAYASAAKSYELQKSSNASSWKTFQTGMLAANNSITSYNFTDGLPYTPNTYYRLKINNDDGSTTYSAIQKVSFNTNINWTIGPNPATDNVTISLQSDRPGSGILTISDITGKVVYEKEIKIAEGENVIKINDLTALRSGQYMISLKNAGQQFTEKLLIRK